MVVEAKLRQEGRFLDTEIRERLSPLDLFIAGHTYQPPRKIWLPHEPSLEIAPHVNKQIYNECYKPIFADGDIPDGFTFSMYPSLRTWIQKSHPKEYKEIRRKIQALPDREYRVLGDPFHHVILPLLPPEDQHMLIEMGKAAFYNDFGFEPKGLWLPELAVSSQTLKAVADNGYEFVVLQKRQVVNPATNPVVVSLGEKNLAVMYVDDQLGAQVSFHGWVTDRADLFLRHRNSKKENVYLATDTEFYGHHHKGKQAFLKTVLSPSLVEKTDFNVFSMRTRLSKGEKEETSIYENSSWSCGHGIDRWKGFCSCDNPTHQANQGKQRLHNSLMLVNEEINKELNGLNSTWRDTFSNVVVGLENEIFTGKDFLSKLKVQTRSEQEFILYAAKIYTILGLTSCGWFFGGGESIERRIPETLSRVVWEQIVSYREKYGNADRRNGHLVFSSSTFD